MTPVELLDDHARRPRNLGKLANANAVGHVGSIVVGDAWRFYIGVSDGRISAAKFQVFNCQSMVASTSAISELAIGKTLAEANALSSTDVCVHLGGLDGAYLPPMLWGLEGVKSATAALDGRELTFDSDYDPLLCRCFGIAEETVRQAIAVNDFTTLSQVTAATSAGTGCGTCQVDINRLIEDVRNPPVRAPKEETEKPQGRIPILHRIQKTVAESIRPQALAIGGDIELWDFDGRTVQVKVTGALANDGAARDGVIAALTSALRAHVAADLEVALA